MHRTVMAVLAAVVLAGAAACQPGPAGRSGAQPAGGSPAPRPAATTGSAATRSAAPPSAAELTVLTEPADGIGPIYQLITSARSSVDLTMYELNDQTAESDLAADAARGVDVRVLLDRHLEKSRNTAAYDYLAAHGVHVTWAPAGTTYHQKTLTVDGATSVIMTLNLVAGDYPDTRDFAVTDTDRSDVAGVVATFDADFAGHAVTPPDGSDLVWSPTNAQASILSVIGGTRRTLAVENEEMGDATITSALASAAQRGVDVTVTMTADSEWDAAFTQLTRAGVHVRLYPDSSRSLYIHAKAIVADAGQPDQRVLVGSENFSVASLDYNRELGIVTGSPAVVSAIAAVLASDAAAASPYVAPAGSPAAQPNAAQPNAAGSLCGAPANPLGLTLCPGGQLVTAPPAGTCGYFHCISNFANGKGYMIECHDGTYSMSGGREGACTDHGGPGSQVYRE